jgi:hypothetical protein
MTQFGQYHCRNTAESCVFPNELPAVAGHRQALRVADDTMVQLLSGSVGLAS